MPHTVYTYPTDRSFTVQTHENILEAALRQGYSFPFGCRTGHCGSCRAKLLQGEVHYGNPLPEGLSKINPRAGEILLCQAYLQSDAQIEIREIERLNQIETKRLPCRVINMVRLAPKVMQLFLKIPDHERLSFLPGQYIDFLLKDGQRRSFSLANSPHYENHLFELHIKHLENGCFTNHVFNSLKEKDILRFEGPLGHFFLHDDSQRPLIFVAGGTGFAPIKSMIEYIIAKESHREIYFYWGVRTRCDLYLNHLVENWVNQHAYIHYTPVLSEPLSTDCWQGRTGLVHTAVLQDISHLNRYDVYASGPPAMVNAIQDSFKQRGLPDSQFFADPFEYAHKIK